VDCDDICALNRFELQFEFLAKNSQISVVGTNVQKFHDQDLEHKSTIIEFPESPEMVEWSMYFYCALAHPSVMMRTSVLRGKISSGGGVYVC